MDSDDTSALSSHLASKLALDHLVNVVASQGQTDEKKGMNSETDQVGWDLKIQAVSQCDCDP